MPPLTRRPAVRTAVKVTSLPVPAVVGRQITGLPGSFTLSSPM